VVFGVSVGVGDGVVVGSGEVVTTATEDGLVEVCAWLLDFRKREKRK